MQEAKTYRLFTDDELKEQVGKAVNLKRNNKCSIITSWEMVEDIAVVTFNNHCGSYSAVDLLEFWAFADGTPCGVKL